MKYIHYHYQFAIWIILRNNLPVIISSDTIACHGNSRGHCELYPELRCFETFVVLVLHVSFASNCFHQYFCFFYCHVSKNQIMYVVASFSKYGSNVSKKIFCNDKNDGECWRNSYGIMIEKTFGRRKSFWIMIKNYLHDVIQRNNSWIVKKNLLGLT